MTKKETAIILRKKGMTLGEIIKNLDIPKGTAWSWIENVVLTDKIKEKLAKVVKEKSRNSIIAYNTKIRPIVAQKIRDDWTNKAKKEIHKISAKELKLVGTAIYWAEGNTKNRNRLQFSNCDPLLVKVAIKFYREICKISNEKIGARVHIYPEMDYEKILDFWSQITALPKQNFYPPQIQTSKASKGIMPRNTLPHGTLHLTVSSTELSSKVKGWIQGISEKI